MFDKAVVRKQREIIAFAQGLLLLVSLLFGAQAYANTHNHIKIGVLAFRGADVTLKRWTPLAQYLERTIPQYHFSIVPLDLSETRDAIARKDVHFILTNPGNFVDLEARYGVSALATMKMSNEQRELSQFGAIIFTRANRNNIRNLKDLRGKKFMGVKKNGFGGFQMAWRELKKHDIDPFTDFEQLSFSGFPQDAVVYAVRDGLVDAGTVRSGTLEKMHAEGLIQLSDFKVLNRKKVAGFPFMLSTDLYPEWPFARLATTPDVLVQKVSLALLAMKMSYVFGSHTGWVEWVSPVSYHNVHKLMAELHVGPYEGVPPFSFVEVLHRYMIWLVVLGVLISITIGFLVKIMILNKRQLSINQELEQQISERAVLEQSLEQERNFLNSILENIRDGVVVCNEKGDLTLFNQAALEMHGIISRNIPVSQWRSYYQLLQMDGVTPLQHNEKPLIRALTGEVFRDMELIIAPHHGEPKNVLASGQPILGDDGLIKGAVVSLFDITLRMEAERRIFESEKELRTILENLQDTFYRISLEGNIERVTPSIERILGYTPEEMLGTQIQDYYVNPNDRSEFHNFLAKHDGKVQDYHLHLRRKDGSEVWMSVTAQYYIDDRGKVLGIEGIARDITSALESKKLLANSEKELRIIMENMQDTFYRTDVEGRIVRISPSVKNLFGYGAEEFLGKYLADFYLEKDGRERFLREFERKGGKIQNYQAPMRRKDGSVLWVSTNAQYYQDENGNILGIEGTTRNITELKQVEASLHQEKERAQITLQSIGDAVITTDISGLIQYINPYAEQMIGISSADVKGRAITEVLSFVDAATQLSHGDPVSECLRRNDILMYSDHMHAIREDGVEFAVKLTVAPMRDQEKTVVGVVLVMHDVSEMWEMARQLSYQAAHDALTGLINRREFERRLEQSLESARQEDLTHILCYMDLDQFKIVNDTCGHSAGDVLLKQLAQLLKSVVRENDIFARLGGDEFGLLLEGCSLDKAGEIAEKIRKTVKEFRFAWEDKYFEVGVSIGIVPITQNSISIAEVLSEADAACYVAKDLGRNRVHRYQSGDADLVRHHAEMQWVQRIREALDEGRFIIYCQRIHSLKDENDRVYSEVLLRMLDEDGDIVLPGAFIPAAERYHLMPEIDRWVIFHVLEAMSMQDSHDLYTCAINLSGQSVGDESMLQFILDQIDRNQLDPSRICFEITETAAVANLDSARRFIDRLHRIGCQFALDDFGSGLSSFAYLKNLNVDFLKIDGSFVRDITIDPVDYAMVASINQIGHLMGIKTIAEFVENEEILFRLRQIGVDFAQGYAVERPAPFERLIPEKLKQV